MLHTGGTLSNAFHQRRSIYQVPIISPCFPISFIPRLKAVGGWKQALASPAHMRPSHFLPRCHGTSGFLSRPTASSLDLQMD